MVCDGVETQVVKSHNDGYGYPTFRYCKVCELIDFMDFDQADGVRVSLGNAWNKILTCITSNPRKYGFSEIIHNGGDPSQDYHEGPSIMLPEFEAKLSFKVKVRASVTVCVPPHHSKLWTRISYVEEDDGFSFSEGDLEEFYSKAAFACEQFAGLLLSEYISALNENDVRDELVPVHEIRIETTSSNLDGIEDFFEDDSIKMSSVLEDDRNFRLLSGFVSRAYGRKVSEIGDVKTMPDNFQWFKMKISKSKSDRGNMVGIYSKEQKQGETKFVGLVHNSFPSYEKSGNITREFSKKLVQHIAPVI